MSKYRMMPTPEIDQVNVFAANVIRGGRPYESAGHIGQRQNAYETCGSGSRNTREVVLNHRGGIFQDANTCGHVGNNTTHQNQNCGVFSASFAETFKLVRIGASVTPVGSHPAGAQSAWGTRITYAPAAIITP